MRGKTALAALLLTLALLLASCGGARESRGNDDNNSIGDVTTVELNERQLRILEDAGLPADYNQLNLTQKSAIESIETMLSYLEEKYEREFVYSGYVPAGGMNQEHLLAYPAGGDPDDTVTVYRRFVENEIQYSDDYANLLAKPFYVQALRTYFDSIFGEDNYKLFVNIVEAEEDVAEDSVLRQASASSSILIDDLVCDEEKLSEVVTAYGDWMKEQSASSQSSTLSFYTMEASVLEAQNRYNYSDNILSRHFLNSKNCSVSGSGSIIIF